MTYKFLWIFAIQCKIESCQNIVHFIPAVKNEDIFCAKTSYEALSSHVIHVGLRDAKIQIGSGEEKHAGKLFIPFKDQIYMLLKKNVCKYWSDIS